MTSSKTLRALPAVALALSILSSGVHAQAAPVTEQQTVTVNAELLSQYVGVYQLAPNATMAITLENGVLFTQLTGQPKFKLMAESESRFALEAIPAAIEFERDAGGAVTAATLHQNGRSLRAPRAGASQ